MAGNLPREFRFSVNVSRLTRLALQLTAPLSNGATQEAGRIRRILTFVFGKGAALDQHREAP